MPVLTTCPHSPSCHPCYGPSGPWSSLVLPSPVSASVNPGATGLHAFYMKTTRPGKMQPFEACPASPDQRGCQDSPGRCPYPTVPRAPISQGPAPWSVVLWMLGKTLCVDVPSHALLGSRFCYYPPPQEAFPDPPAHHGPSLASPFTPFPIPGRVVEMFTMWALKQPPAWATARPCHSLAVCL